MSYYTERQVRDAAERVGGYTTYGAQNVLRKEAKPWRTSFDVFLSHAFLDFQQILGVKAILESLDLHVYVDWIDDPELDRSKVDVATANRLRQRLRQSQSLVFVTSRASVDSKWMPWELGYFDGFRGPSRVAIFPIVETAGEGFSGQEYLGLYPKIQHLQQLGSYRFEPAVTKGSQLRFEALPMRNFVAGTGSFSTSTYR